MSLRLKSYFNLSSFMNKNRCGLNWKKGKQTTIGQVKNIWLLVKFRCPRHFENIQ